MTDTIADLLTRIRNAQAVNKKEVTVPMSHTIEAILKTLKAENYIEDYQVIKKEPQNQINITLKYINRMPVITQIKRVSRPGRRVYLSAKEITPVLGGHGIMILTTNQGVMTNKQARVKNCGGEVLCQIW